MKKIAILFQVPVLIVLLFPIAEVSAQTWIERSSISTARWWPCSAVLDDKIYVIGGQGETAPYPAMELVEVYDVSNYTCETLTPMELGRWGANCAVVGGKIYVIGGMTGSFSGGFTETGEGEVYDPVADSWSSIAQMPSARGYGGCAVYNDTIFVFGGYGATSTIEKYFPPTDTWFTEDDMPFGRYSFMTAQANNKVYLIGGWGSDTVQEYDPVTKTWSTATSMPTARGGSAIAVVNDTLFVAGGRGGDCNEFECYDPATDSWNTLTAMPTAREGLVGAEVDGRFFAITGSTPISQGGYPFFDIVEEAILNTSGVTQHGSGSELSVSLSVNPNPFTSYLTLSYSLDFPQQLMLGIYDIRGRRLALLVRNEFTQSGIHSVSWDGLDDNGKEVPSGTYLICIETDIASVVSKVVLLR